VEGQKCVHGIDSRFCAVCNKVSAFGRPRAAIGSATLTEILEFLDAEQVRATHGAVAEVLGINPAALGDRLGDRAAQRGEVNAIASGMELAMRMTAWTGKRRA
jgi:hypothetical protein